MAKSVDYDKCTRGVRSALIIGNGIFCLLGCAVVAVGIYLIIDKVYFVQWVYGTQIIAAACYLIISAGVILFLVSFAGCFGTIFESRILLLFYCVVLSLVFILGVLGSVLAIVYRAWVADMVRYYMSESLLSVYGYTMQNEYNNLVTRSWDEVQEKFGCCAVDDQGWALYRQSFWYKDLPGKTEVSKPYVPFSCCKRDGSGKYVDQQMCQFNANGPPGLPPVLSPGVLPGPANYAIYYKGCFGAGKNVMSQMVVYFIVIGFVMAGIVVEGIVCSLILYRKF